MYRIVLFCCLLVNSLSGFSQREELRNLVKEFHTRVNRSAPFNMQYTLTIQGRAEQPEKESMVMNYYKAGEKSRMVMGEAQEVMQVGSLVVGVNHVQKLITVVNDTSKVTSGLGMFDDLIMLVDSAQQVVVSKLDKSDIYTLTFASDYIYTTLQLKFSHKSHMLEKMYAEFNPQYQEPYYSMQVDYTLWDDKWKPESGFPMLEKFVILKDKKYHPQSDWRSYQLLQQ